MALRLEHEDHAIAGTFDTTAPASPWPRRVVLATLAAGAVAALWAYGSIAPLAVVMMLVVFVLVPKPPRHVQPVDVSGPLLDLLDKVLPGRVRAVGRFRVSGPWLEVDRGAESDRLFLPQCRVDTLADGLRITNRLTGQAVVIGASRGQAAEVAMLADALRGVARDKAGTQQDVPAALRAIRGQPEQG